MRASEPWSEAEYTAHLRDERHLFAWCLIKYGAADPVEAQNTAEGRYPYEAANEPHRGLIFHDEAWHWAMLHLFGEGYWLAHPDFKSASQEYRVEASRQPYDT